MSFERSVPSVVPPPSYPLARHALFPHHGTACRTASDGFAVVGKNGCGDNVEASNCTRDAADAGGSEEAAGITDASSNSKSSGNGSGCTVVKGALLSACQPMAVLADLQPTEAPCTPNAEVSSGGSSSAGTVRLADVSSPLVSSCGKCATQAVPPCSATALTSPVMREAPPHIPQPDVNLLRTHFTAGGLLTDADALVIIRAAATLFATEPNVLRVNDPITICGDIHGQFYDLLTMFRMAGDPPETQYLFLGDYVDRGSFSCEVTLYLFALKLRYPQSVWLLRGNHECRHLSTHFNFKEECLYKYSLEVYEAFQSAFDRLPLAAVVGDAFLCVHGGLSPGIKTVDDISRIFRFREPPTSGAMCDLLWSDPMEDDEEQLCPDAMFLHNEMRGCSYVYSSLAVEQFLRANQLLSVIRAHEAQEEGFRMFRKVKETGFPSVMCIFSAPNYCDTYHNKASILQLSNKILRIRQYNAVPHPYTLPNFMNAFTWSLPFVSDKLQDVLEVLLLDESP